MSGTLDREILALMRHTAETVVMPRYHNLADDEIIQKAVDDPVTIADREAEAMLSEGLHKLLPEAAIVGEEAAFADPAVLRGLSDLCWIIDPIDGTRNFASGTGPFVLMVALADAGITQGAWIYDPQRDRLCHATLGKGAKVDGEPISAKLSGTEPPRLAAMTSYMQPHQRDLFEREIAPHYSVADAPGCAGEQYPLVTFGDHDAAIYQRTLAWDHAAGALFLNEAGGKCARLDGSAYRVDSQRKGMVGAASSALFDEITERLTKAGYSPEE
ncbi:inositol monophosphatase family protein [Altericroceibacterium endophyticum]|uniref:Inositol monophosphatase n=1 Tax=Altericroceibacterium endophyticum TaxID=1808508 RepID=A0A6I4T1H0_9SPHN|nr:inositol monophosphatase family protein [Altericroceibacterium endophyticum]MXO64728.1 inositol monophosphatase [Altericroceibacterium endophyticum]